jgi:hypothetical protein
MGGLGFMTKFDSLKKIERSIASAVGPARETAVEKLEAELDRLQDEGLITECQAKDRLQAWAYDAVDDQFDNLPV